MIPTDNVSSYYLNKYYTSYKYLAVFCTALLCGVLPAHVSVSHGLIFSTGRIVL